MMEQQERICYHVFEVDGLWTVSFDGGPPIRDFPNRERALAAAREAAEARWLMTGLPSCTRIGREDDLGEDDSSFG
ncbi:MAG: hypothetical protein ABIR16_05695 [Dokdonella sp.]